MYAKTKIVADHSSFNDRIFTQLISSFIAFFLCFQMMSCMPVAMLVYGMHQPRYLSNEGVKRYAHRLGLEDDIYRLKYYNEATIPKYRYTGNSMPDILLFNSSGQLTKFETDCSSDLDSIAKLSPKDIDNLNLAEKSLTDFIGDTYIINTKTIEDQTLLKMPLYVVKFAEYAGRLNKDNVPALVERLSNRTDVQYIILNVDYSLDD